MTQPRSQIVQPEHTRHHHCVARCVRRAWLCGEDDYTGRNFDHRKSWLLARMKMLEEVFAIRTAAYVVTGNRYHVVLYLNIEQGRSWDRDEVIRRWLRLFSGDPLARTYLRGELDGAAHGQLDVLAGTAVREVSAGRKFEAGLLRRVAEAPVGAALEFDQ